MFKYVFINENNDMYISKPCENDDVKPAPINDLDLCIGKIEYDERYSEAVSKMNRYEVTADQMKEVTDVIAPETLEDLISVVALRYAEGSFAYYKELLEAGNEVDKEHILATRDDIYRYLIFSGIDEDVCFEITEYVRKGKSNFQKKSKEWLDYKEILKNENKLLWFVYMSEQATYIPPKEMVLNYLVDYWNKDYFGKNEMADRFRKLIAARTISEEKAEEILAKRLEKVAPGAFFKTFKEAIVYQKYTDGNNYCLKVGVRVHEDGIRTMLNEGINLETGEIVKGKISGVSIASRVDAGERIFCNWCYKGVIINENDAGIYYRCTNPECKCMVHILKRHMAIDYAMGNKITKIVYKSKGIDFARDFGDKKINITVTSDGTLSDDIYGAGSRKPDRSITVNIPKEEFYKLCEKLEFIKNNADNPHDGNCFRDNRDAYFIFYYENRKRIKCRRTLKYNNEYLDHVFTHFLEKYIDDWYSY